MSRTCITKISPFIRLFAFISDSKRPHNKVYFRTVLSIIVSYRFKIGVHLTLGLWVLTSHTAFSALFWQRDKTWPVPLQTRTLRKLSGPVDSIIVLHFTWSHTPTWCLLRLIVSTSENTHITIDWATRTFFYRYTRRQHQSWTFQRYTHVIQHQVVYAE